MTNQIPGPELTAVFFASGGNDDRNGSNNTFAVSSLPNAIAKALLLPPITLGSNVSVVNLGAGIFVGSVEIPDKIQVLSAGASYTSDDDKFTIKCGSQSVFRCVEVENTDVGAAVLMEDIADSGLIVEALSASGGGAALSIAGEITRCFAKATQLNVNGGIGLLMNTINELPISVGNDQIVLNAIGDVGCDISAGNGGANLNLGTIHSAVAGTIGLIGRSGEITSTSGEITADTGIVVKAGCIWWLNDSIIAGDIVVEVGGILNCRIWQPSGIVSNAGIINGIINGVRYGNWEVFTETLRTVETDVYQALVPDGAGSTKWSTGIIKNREIINSASQFPTAIEGKIPLVAGTEYYIGASGVSVTDKFTPATNVVFTGAPGPSFLTYTGTGSMFEGGDLGLFTVRGLILDLPNGGQVIEVTDTVPQSSTINFLDYRIISAGKFGTFTDVLGFISNLGSALDIDDGITMVGTNAVVSLSQTAFFSTSPTYKGLDLGASIVPTFEAVNFLNVAPAGAVGISGLVDNGNIPAGSIATVASCDFLGGMDALENITVDDFRWAFVGNGGIPDTNPDALLDFDDNVTATSIAMADTPVNINAGVGGCIIESDSHFTANVDGSVTYDGERPLSAPIDLECGVLGSTFDAYVAISIDDSVIATGVPISVSPSKPALVRLIWQYQFQPGETLRPMVANKDSTSNPTVQSAKLRIR